MTAVLDQPHTSETAVAAVTAAYPNVTALICQVRDYASSRCRLQHAALLQPVPLVLLAQQAGSSCQLLWRMHTQTAVQGMQPARTYMRPAV